MDEGNPLQALTICGLPARLAKFGLKDSEYEVACIAERSEVYEFQGKVSLLFCVSLAYFCDHLLLW